ncbi:MAG: hypothetical protein QNJ35_16740 [Paracoccaceae bacterium]|nr:hypothetical protein [Paracoccaceae bacterium]
MSGETPNWTADPLIWGSGERLFEAFLEPTCPFSARAFGKLDDLLQHAGPDRLRVRIWLHSQPWHMFSGLICRAIAAASTGPEGKEAAKRLMESIYARREEFEFDDHRTGPNLDTSPNDVIRRLEEASGIALSERFQISGLESVVKQHVRYARQNGIHVSPTLMVDGLINPSISSGDSVEEWAERILGPR